VIVLDASVAYAFVLRDPSGSLVNTLLAEGALMAAPHLIDAEVGHAIRSNVRRGVVSSERGLAAIKTMLALPLERYAHGPLLERAFDFRDNATIYDAVYLALAEALIAPLLTLDRALTRVPGILAEVRLLV